MEKSMPLKERHPWLILGGLITTLLSLAVFHAGQLFSFDSANFDLDRFFLGNYTIAVVWMLVASFHNVSVSGWRRLFQLEPPLYRIAITLFTISAFSLNRSLNVLGETPIWVGVYLYITYVALFVDIYADQLPQAINRAINFLAGMGTLMVFYFLLLTIPALPFSLVGGIYFGISWHMFAPLFAFLGFLGVLRKRKASDMRISFLVGLAVPIFVLIAYTIQVQQVSADLERVSASYHSSNSPLPEPVFAGQYLQDRLFSAHIMRENTPNGQFRDVFNMGSVNDPLAIIAQEFSKSLSMSKSNRAKVLAARTNLKHESQRRLWSGGNLL
ncbi:MAG TPA: hypothetical protein ENJ82_09535, partial [Bacteroidetes bacterium]|nr:hypothetical protein [Bacteroidota bacterium]